MLVAVEEEVHAVIKEDILKTMDAHAQRLCRGIAVTITRAINGAVPVDGETAFGFGSWLSLPFFFPPFF